MSHTPGPWTYRLQVSDFIIETQPHGEDIAVIHSNIGGTTGDHANARLIAAAPDLLAALKALHRAICDYTIPERDAELLTALEVVGGQVEAAIAKTDGREG